MNMKGLLALLFCVVMMWSIPDAVQAQEDLLAVVSGGKADRVHLRKAADGDAKSMGLYFTGAPVVRVEASRDGWTEVIIGAERGFIRSDLLEDYDTFDFAERKWRQAYVRTSGAVNLRAAPTKEATALTSVKSGEKVTVLGETVSSWYYVRYGETYGYMMARFMRIENTQPEYSTGKKIDVPFELPAEFWTTTGAGAIHAHMVILPDGEVWGYYQDTDLGDDGEGNTIEIKYMSSFNGRFAGAKKANQWEYRMKLEDMQCFGLKGQREERGDVHYVTLPTCCVTKNEVFSFYSADAPTSKLPESYKFWARNFSEWRDDLTGLYGHKGDYLWLLW